MNEDVRVSISNMERQLKEMIGSIEVDLIPGSLIFDDSVLTHV